MINWTLEELQKHIETIVFSQKLVSITLSYERLPTYILFKYPSRRLILLAELEERTITDRALADNFLTEEQMMILLRERKIWTDEDDAMVEDLQEKIIKWKGKLIDPDLTDNSKKYAAELVAKLEEKVFTIELKKEKALQNTVERRARQAKYDFMAWGCTYNPLTDNLLWDNYLTYCEKVEPELKSKLLGEFLKLLVGHTTEEIRYIARNNLWRLDYIIAQKGNLPLFPKAATELTPDQKNLLWWAGYYQSLNEMLPEDQPDEWLIQDDEALDDYMTKLHQEREKDRYTHKAEKTHGAGTAEKMAERLIMESHPEYLKRKYDKVNVNASSSTTDLRVESESEGAKFKKMKGFQKTKKFTPPSKET